MPQIRSNGFNFTLSKKLKHEIKNSGAPIKELNAWFALGYSALFRPKKKGAKCGIYSEQNVLAIADFGSRTFNKFMIVVPDQLERYNWLSKKGMPFREVGLFESYDAPLSSRYFPTTHDQIRYSNQEEAFMKKADKLKAFANRIASSVPCAENIEIAPISSFLLHFFPREQIAALVLQKKNEVTAMLDFAHAVESHVHSALRSSEDLRKKLIGRVIEKVRKAERALFEKRVERALGKGYLDGDNRKRLDWKRFRKERDDRLLDFVGGCFFRNEEELRHYAKEFKKDKGAIWDFVDEDVDDAHEVLDRINSYELNEKARRSFDSMRWMFEYAIEETALIAIMNKQFGYSVKVGPWEERLFDDFAMGVIGMETPQLPNPAGKRGDYEFIYLNHE